MMPYGINGWLEDRFLVACLDYQPTFFSPPEHNILASHLYHIYSIGLFSAHVDFLDNMSIECPSQAQREPGTILTALATPKNLEVVGIPAVSCLFYSCFSCLLYSYQSFGLADCPRSLV